MDASSRFAIPEEGRIVTLLDVVSAVSELAFDEREVTAVVLHLLESGAIRWVRPPWEVAN